jgi:hypothetical protein
MQPNSVNQPGTLAAPWSAGSPLPKEISRMPVQDFLAMANWQGLPVAPLMKNPLGTDPLGTNSPQVGSTALAQEINSSEINSGERNSDERNYSPAPNESWLCLTVEQFFGRQNWQGLAQSPLPQPSPSPVETATVLPPVPTVKPTLERTVQEFFQGFPWEGLPAIGALPKAAPVAEPSEPEMTLSDLSDLF